jgi:hypothetical protein
MSTPPKSSVLHPFIPPSPQHLSTNELLTVSTVFPFPKCHKVGIIQGVTFEEWLLSLSGMHVDFLHVFSWLDSSFLSTTEYCSTAWMYHRSFTHCLLKAILCFQVLAIMNRCAVNICVQVFVGLYIFSSYGHIAGTTNAGSYV